MTGRECGGLAFALALALAPAAARGDGQQDRAATWTEKGLEAASPYAGAASDAYGGASGAIDAARRLRASDVALSEGNRAARHVVAAEYNAVRRSGQHLVKAAERFHLGAATTVADVGGTLAAHVVEGDFRSVPGVVANAAAKTAATSGGAWAGGATGAAAGSLLGPVGTLVGGAIGAAAGSVGAAWGYDTASAALETNGYGNVQAYVDGLMAEDPRAAFRAAQEARREWLRERGLEPIVAGDPGFAREDPRAAASPAPDAPPPPAASTSIIPDDCTLEVVLWQVAAPQHKWHGTIRVNGETVTGAGEMTMPGSQGNGFRTTTMHTVDEFTGTRRENVLVTEGKTRTGPTRNETWTASSRCTIEWWTNATARGEWTLEPGGRGHLRVRGRSTTTTRYAGACGSNADDTRSESFDTGGAGELPFTWTVR